MLIAAALAAAGCGRSEAPRAPPPPAEVTADSTGHYCGMLLIDHAGPKGQVRLASRPDPVWFSSARDAIAFLRQPDEPRDIVAVYVSDMARATTWDQPERGAWVDARTAWFVIDSDRRGGMGAPEAVPFSDAAAAKAFGTRHHGRVVQLAGIPDAYVLGPVDVGGRAGASPASGGMR
jgi:copper chaperone NosL